MKRNRRKVRKITKYSKTEQQLIESLQAYEDYRQLIYAMFVLNIDEREYEKSPIFKGIPF